MPTSRHWKPLVRRALERLGGHGYYMPRYNKPTTIYDMVKTLYEENGRGHIDERCQEEMSGNYCNDYTCEKCKRKKEWFVYDQQNIRTSRTFKGTIRNILHERELTESRRIFIDLSEDLASKTNKNGHWGLRQNYIRHSRWNEHDIKSLIDKWFFEGDENVRNHRVWERDPELVKEAKRKFKEKNEGRLFCELCCFDFSFQYGEIGSDFIEAHHLLPLSISRGRRITNYKDLMLLCPNCHSMVHRYLKIDEYYTKTDIENVLKVRKSWKEMEVE